MKSTALASAMLLTVLAVTRVVSAGTDDHNCPAGLEYIGGSGGEANQGQPAFSKWVVIDFPQGFDVDITYQQPGSVACCGGGATSQWSGSQIPAGVYLETAGGHYWSFGAGDNGVGFPKLTPKSLRPGKEPATYIVDQWQFGIQTYCGPAAPPGPGCNAKFKVCAKRRAAKAPAAAPAPDAKSKS
jgi:hypothetical protein